MSLKKRVKLIGLGFLVGSAASSWIAQQRLKNFRTVPSFLIKDNVGSALITGASSGIGTAFVDRLAAKGFKPILVARREDRMEEIAHKIKLKYDIESEIIPTDLSDPEQVARLEQQIAERDDIMILVNNAGFGTQQHFLEIEQDKQLDMIHVNVIAAVRLAYAVLPQMIERERGFIINVSSIAAFVANKGNATYGATKSYLNLFSQSLNLELEGTGVQVQALCPGFTTTEFHDSAEFEDFERDQIPDPLWMSPEEVVDESLIALNKNEVVVLPGLHNRLVRIISGLPLGSLLLKTIRQIF